MDSILNPCMNKSLVIWCDVWSESSQVVIMGILNINLDKFCADLSCRWNSASIESSFHIVTYFHEKQEVECTFGRQLIWTLKSGCVAIAYQWYSGICQGEGDKAKPLYFRKMGQDLSWQTLEDFFYIAVGDWRNWRLIYGWMS